MKKSSLFRILILTAVVLPLLNQNLRLPTANAQTRNAARQLEQAEAVRAWPSKAKRWALIIGVDKYRDGQISPLKGSANDARMLSDALVRYAGFPQDQVILLATDQPEERQPTRINILTMLSNLHSLVPKDGLLLVSFSGHGIERSGQAYLIPSDARLTDDVSLLEESAVSVTRARERIKATGVGQVIVLLDACRNDPGGRADAPNPLTAAYTRGFNFDVRNREVQAFATVYATAVGQRAYEYTEKRQGYFTWAIVEGLKGGAANEKGEVTLAQLVKYVQENVPKRISIDLGASKQQRPFAVIEGYRAEDLVIAVAAPGASNAANAPSVSTTDPAAVELSFWESIKSSTDPADFQAYLDKYPDGAFAPLARKRSQPAAGSSGSSSALPSLDHLLARAIEAQGGKTAIEKLTTITMRGLVEMTASGRTFQGTVESYAKVPNKSLTITVIPGIKYKVEEGYDGQLAWRKDSHGVVVKSEWQQAFTKRNMELSYMTDPNKFRELYPQAVIKGTEKVGDYETYVVEATPAIGKPETFYFDQKTGLIVRWDVKYESNDAQKGVTTPIQLFVDEYADVAGVKIPMVIRQTGSGTIFINRFFDIKYNVPLDDAKFDKPKK